MVTWISPSTPISCQRIVTSWVGVSPLRRAAASAACRILQVSRPPIDVVINGTLRFYRNGSLDTTYSRVSRTAFEQTTGTVRRHPTSSWIAPTAYTLDRKVRVVRNGSRKLVLSAGGSREYEGPYGSFAAAGSDGNRYDETLLETWMNVPSALSNEALIKARLKMKQGDLNLGVAFAERNKTAQLLTNTAGRLVKSIRALKRGNFAEAWRQLGQSSRHRPRGSSVPRQWLEMQYGWQPLLSDVYGSVEALTKQPSSAWRITGKGFAREDLDKVKTDFGTTELCEVSVRGWRGAFVRIDALPENDLLMTLSSLGITNPALIGWELVPFSFIVDWALPIGSYLESLDAMLGYGATKCSISKFSTTDWVCKSRTGFHGVGTWSHAGADGYQKLRRLNRTVSNTVPLPSLPRIRNPVTMTRMANAISLLSTAFR
jgi:hypothetical protein